MPFLGQDWRSPGQCWVKTEDGWKKTVDDKNIISVERFVINLPNTETSLRLKNMTEIVDDPQKYKQS